MDPRDRNDTVSSPSAFGSKAQGSETQSEYSPEGLTQDFEAVKSRAMDDLDAIREKAAEDVRSLKHEAQAQVEKVSETAKGFASEQKDLAMRQLDGVAQALHRVAGDLESGEQAGIGRYAHELAAGAERISREIGNRDIDDLMSMAQDFGRKQPAVFLGAAALIGFAASRFAMASAHRTSAKQHTAPTMPREPEDRFSARTNGVGTASNGSGHNVYGQ